MLKKLIWVGYEVQELFKVFFVMRLIKLVVKCTFF